MVVWAHDPELEKRIGVFQEIYKISDTLNEAKLSQIAETTMKVNNFPVSDLKIRATGIPDVITGYGVFVSIKDLGIGRSFYVNRDVHIFEDDMHLMELELRPVEDAYLIKPDPEPKKKRSVDKFWLTFPEFYDGETVTSDNETYAHKFRPEISTNYVFTANQTKSN